LPGGWGESRSPRFEAVAAPLTIRQLSGNHPGQILPKPSPNPSQAGIIPHFLF
jgi:hypothetical protein